MADDSGPAFRPRQVFVSHSHADKALAALLGQLLDNTFSGLLTAFCSSDPTPTGGVRPGEDWDMRIHAELAASEAVWVLVTPSSINRPWVYWEAGLGHALCPRGVIVLRVNLKPEEVLSPLNRFQSYDGLSIESGGLRELLDKLGIVLGMRVSSQWIEWCAKRFVAQAEQHQPAKVPAVHEPQIAPEQLGRVDSIVARLEAITIAAEGTRGQVARATDESPNVSARFALLGRDDARYSVEDLLATVDGVPATTRFEPLVIDADGDVSITVSDSVRCPGRAAFIFLIPDAKALALAQRRARGRMAELLTAIHRLQSRKSPRRVRR